MAHTAQLHKDLRAINVLEGFYDVTADATGKRLGTLPRGAHVLRVTTINKTVWNGTAPSATLGWSTDTDALATATDTNVGVLGINQSASMTLDTAGLYTPLAADRNVIVTATEDSSTAGYSYFYIEYVFPFSADTPD